MTEPNKSQAIVQKRFKKGHFLAFFNNKPEVVAEIYYQLWRYKHSYNLIYASQSTLARATGYSRQWTNYAIGVLEKYGLIEREKRSHKTNIYHFPAFLNDEINAKELGSFFRLWFALSVSLLTPIVRQASDLTQLNIYLDLSKSNSSIHSVSHSTHVTHARVHTPVREDPAATQREKLIAQLTSEQRLQLDRLRAGYKNNPHYGASSVHSAPSKPQTLRDVLNERGFELD